MTPKRMNLIFVIPVFNDWASFRQLVGNIDRAIASIDCRATILVIDDGSTDLADGDWSVRGYSRVTAIDVVVLACNLGHQKAIAIGLSLAVKREGIDALFVMDGDGEDNPADLPLLLESLLARKAPVVMAHRSRRSEGAVFKMFYAVYKSLFHSLTGASLSFGNYCALMPAAARRLTFMPNLWNSLPATCLRSKLPLTTVPTARSQRYAGEGKMSFVGLILHGLQAITVFSDTVLVRLSFLAVMMSALTILAVVAVRLSNFVTLSPGWASTIVVLMSLSLLTVLFGLLTTSLLTLQERCSMPMIPFIHAELYVQEVRQLSP